ncbi:hypothetical protein L3Q82_006285 [Scortum barcoo]|uniref:Uncharacterized protein n=1 Tax=Scortum barcoo TaxID=214431 RepID=A0ACB8X2H1_9TELE|nr:hypothetical protein L3Q82_006285 [Scortum barcoo]
MVTCSEASNRTMDLSLRDALGGGGGGVPGGAPAEALLKRDFVATLEKESYDDKVGETVSKSDYRPLLDGKDTKSGKLFLLKEWGMCLSFHFSVNNVEVFLSSAVGKLANGGDSDIFSGPGMMSSVMSSGGRQDPPGQPAFSSDYLSGFSQSGMGGTMGSSMPPFQTTMSSTLGQTGMGSAMDTQKSSGLFGVDNKTTSNTSGSSPFKTSDLFSSGGPGIHSTDHSTALVLSPSGSMDDSSPSSSTSEPLSPERVGPGGEAGKQRRKKKRKGHNEVHDFLDNQENNISQSDKRGVQDKGGWEAEEDEDEEENWEWEIRESGGGGRVKGKKTKSRARLPEEWGAPQQPNSPTPATVAPTWATTANSGPSDAKAPNSSHSPVLPSAPEQIPTSFTNRSHASLLTDSSPRSYEPMCVDDFPISAKDGQKENEENVLTSKPEPNNSLAASATSKSSLTRDVSNSLALMAGDNLSPVSQTFSFLDSVLQTPPGSTPDSQTTTPITITPSLATAPLTKSTPADITIPVSQATSIFNPSKGTSDLPPTSAFSTKPSSLDPADTQPSTTTVGSALNVDAKPFIPSATLISSTATPSMTAATPDVSTAAETTTGTTATASSTASAMPLSSSASPCKIEATFTSSLGTPPKSAATPYSSATSTPPPIITPAAPPSLPALSEHQESSSPQLPPLEVYNTYSLKDSFSIEAAEINCKTTCNFQVSSKTTLTGEKRAGGKTEEKKSKNYRTDKRRSK